MRSLVAALALTLAAAPTLGGCGFQPMYAPSTGAAIGNVEVAQIDGKAGHVLKTELDRILAADAGAGAPTNRLEITLVESVSRLGIRLDESASRAELRLVANYVLTPDNGEVIRGRLDSVVNYEIPFSAFGEISAQDDARERAAEVLAQRVRVELAMRLAQARGARAS